MSNPQTETNDSHLWVIGLVADLPFSAPHLPPPLPYCLPPAAKLKSKWAPSARQQATCFSTSDQGLLQKQTLKRGKTESWTPHIHLTFTFIPAELSASSRNNSTASTTDEGCLSLKLHTSSCSIFLINKMCVFITGSYFLEMLFCLSRFIS